MRIILLLCLCLTLHARTLAAEGVSVPWEEIKMVYAENLKRRLADQAGQLAPRRLPQTSTIDEAIYQLAIGDQGVRGKALISGKVISGGPEAIALFGNDLIINGATQMSGGVLFASTTESQRIQFLPEGTARDFQIGVSFLVPIREDNRSKFVSFAIPRGLRNSLQISLPPDARLVEATGIADESGQFHFSLEDKLVVRYVEKSELSAAVAVPIDIDGYSNVEIQGRRLVVSSHFAPANPIQSPFQIRLPAPAQYLTSTLKSSWIARKEGNTFEVRLPADQNAPFTIQYALDEAQPSSFTLVLPSIPDNNGRDGYFNIEEPDDAQLSVSAERLASRIPVGRVSAALRPLAGERPLMMHAAAGQAVGVGLKRFEAISAPLIVLDSQYFFASFEENGSNLSVLVMEVPSDVGPRLTLRPVSGATIWSLKVNGENRKLYANQADAWVVPLDEGKPSRVELALLTKGEKLGLNGRLECTVPETGLAARVLRVGIALPERVELRSMEGPVSPAKEGSSWPMPADFIGRPHFFSRTFHKGEQVNLAVSYKEPVKQ